MVVRESHVLVVGIHVVIVALHLGMVWDADASEGVHGACIEQDVAMPVTYDACRRAALATLPAHTHHGHVPGVGRILPCAVRPCC